MLFADDINLLIIERDEKVLQHKVNEVMKKLEYWFQNNNLMINIEKTIAMSYCTMQNRFPMRPKITYKNKYKISWYLHCRKFKMDNSFKYIKPTTL